MRRCVGLVRPLTPNVERPNQLDVIHEGGVRVRAVSDEHDELGFVIILAGNAHDFDGIAFNAAGDVSSGDGFEGFDGDQLDFSEWRRLLGRG